MQDYMKRDDGGYYEHLATIKDFSAKLKQRGQGKERELIEDLISRAKSHKKGIELRLYFPEEQNYLIPIFQEYDFYLLATGVVEDYERQILMTKVIKGQE